MRATGFRKMPIRSTERNQTARSSKSAVQKNTKSPVGREKLRIPPGGSKLIGWHTVDRLEGHWTWPSCMYVYLSTVSKFILLLHQGHGGFLERVYESELDTKTEYEGFLGTLSTFQNGYF